LVGFSTTEVYSGAGADIVMESIALPTASLPVGAQAAFTFFWPKENRWEGTDYAVTVE